MTDTSPADAPDRCPRCGGSFACGMGGAGPCACTTLRLDAATLARLRGEFSGCLCLGCLAELVSEAAGPHAADSLASSTL